MRKRVGRKVPCHWDCLPTEVFRILGVVPVQMSTSVSTVNNKRKYVAIASAQASTSAPPSESRRHSKPLLRISGLFSQGFQKFRERRQRRQLSGEKFPPLIQRTAPARAPLTLPGGKCPAVRRCEYRRPPDPSATIAIRLECRPLSFSWM